MLPPQPMRFLLPLVLALLPLALRAEGEVDFASEIRPLLGKHCVACHGPDEAKRKADLRLDLESGLLNPEVIKRGKPDESELMHRLTTTDPDEVMPPPDKGTPVPAADVEKIRKWIAQGAPFGAHWAFTPVRKPAVPAVAPPVTQGLDAFVISALKAKGMEPAEEASREVWLRRVCMDLTGLPPSLAEQDAFLADASDDAFEKVVKRLLDSPAYGERMASDWLDVARYADTYGRHEDQDCITWPYRDWVIRAFNQNLRYNDFITWQTAGDLLPNPTEDMMIATCFNRLAQQSNEAGSDAEEFRIEQVADRVRTNGTAFLGLSMDCARCHDHKYDPLTMKDYYGLAAMLNNIDELGLYAVYNTGVPTPSILLFQEPWPKQYFGQLNETIAQREQELEALRPGAKNRFEKWLTTKQPPMVKSKTLMEKITSWFSEDLPVARFRRPVVHFDFQEEKDKLFRNLVTGKPSGALKLKKKPVPAKEGNGLHFAGDNHFMINDLKEPNRTTPFSMALWFKPEESIKRGVVACRCRSGIDSAYRGLELVVENDRPSFALVHFAPGNEIRIRARDPLPINAWTHIICTYDGSSRASGLKMFINGKEPAFEVLKDNLYHDIVYREEWGDEFAKDGVELQFTLGSRYNDTPLKNAIIDEFKFYNCALTAPEAAIIAGQPDFSKVEDWFPWYLRDRDEVWRAAQRRLEQARQKQNRYVPHGTELMVMKELEGPRRQTHVLKRGQFNQPGEEVQPSVPAALMPLPDGAPRNRLGLAQWLTSPQNPLTARVAVNRFWQQFFGRGLVTTTEDFGTQGQYPSNRELLDWLAATFVEGGWDVKQFCRDIVLSKTYRQSSTPKDLAWLKSDPDNALLARGPRHRLGAEQVRDLALVASGLLVNKIGGPSVRPYQPQGLWEDSGTQHHYVESKGAGLYRRSLYTFWRRTLPPPSMTIFDAPTREFCKVRRDRTATPLQALVLMNDPQFLEACRVLAIKLVREQKESPEQRVTTAFRLLTSARPSAEQIASLTAYLSQEKEQFTKAPEQAQKMLSAMGKSFHYEHLDHADIAATTMMLRMLFGFSETTMKP